MFRYSYPLAFLLASMTLTPLTPTFAQDAASPAKKLLAPVPNRFQLNKGQWTMADRAWFERDAVTQAPNLIATLSSVAAVANTIDGDPNSPNYGWQKSDLYRHGQKGPTNARLMEPVYTLAWAYTLDKPWNPYYHDAILRPRMEAGLAYWLSLQGEDGGFSENRGKGGQELPPTSFALEFLVEIHEMLDKDGTADPKLRAHLLDSIERAITWAVTDDGARNQGHVFSNQYCGVMYSTYRMWQLTGDEKWKKTFDASLDDWLEHVQPALFWLEGNGVETFAYSQVTEWEMDRLLMISKDPRILDSFRKYYEWCGLNTLPENDGATFVMDIAGHERTTRNDLPGMVGYYNHIISEVPAARPWATRYQQTPAQREARIVDWLVNPIPPTSSAAERDSTSAYHPFHNYPMYFEPLGIWTESEQERAQAVQQLPTLRQQRFTRYFSVPVGEDQFLFARRPGVYATMHWGKADGRQVKEVGLVWLPGFGTLVRSVGDDPKNAFSTRMGKETTYRKTISDFKVPASFKNAPENGEVEAGDLQFATNFDGKGIAKSYRITDDALEVTTRTTETATDQIPLYLDAEDTISVDGNAWDYRTDADAPPVNFAGRSLRVKRVCGGVTAYATIEFGADTTGTLKRSYDLARGAVYVLSVAVPAKTDFVTRIHKG